MKDSASMQNATNRACCCYLGESSLTQATDKHVQDCYLLKPYLCSRCRYQ